MSDYMGITNMPIKSPIDGEVYEAPSLVSWDAERKATSSTRGCNLMDSVAMWDYVCTISSWLAISLCRAKILSL